MRILVLITDGYGGIGGIAKFNRDFLKALCAHPVCSEVLVIPRLLKKIEEMPSLPAKLTYVVSGVNNKLKFLFTIGRMLFSKSKFDLIVCGHIHLVPIAILLKLIKHCPVFLIIHGVEAWNPTTAFLTNRFAAYINGCISVSEFTREKFLKWAHISPQKCYIVPNCIDVKIFKAPDRPDELMRRYGLEGKKVLLSLARLSSHERYKGMDEVMEIMPDLLKKNPHLVFIIIGDGDDRSRLESKAKSLKIKNSIIFTGYIAEEKKADYYRLADAYVMPGWGEGFGIVYLEAMACGIPVVGSKLDGSQEALMGGKLGILVDPKDPEDLKRGILEALERPKGNSPSGLEYFSYENFEKRVHTILDQLFESK